MNVLFDRKFPTPVCLVLVAAIPVALVSCGGPAENVGQQKSETIQIDQVSEDGDSAQQTLQLRNFINDTKQNVEEGNWNEAIDKYTNALGHQWPGSFDRRFIRMHNAELFLLRGQAFLAKELPQIAIEDFGDAIEFGDDELKSKAYVERAKAVRKLKRWSEVVLDCTRAIRLQPSNGDAYLVRGQALAELRQWDQARNSMLEAERLGIRTTYKIPIPESVPNVLDQAKSLLDTGSPVMAREILESAMLKGEDTYETNGMLARTQFDLNEFQRAIAASTRALKLNPRFADAYRVRGLSWLKRNYLDRAIADLDAAIAMDASLTEQLTPYLSEARRRGGIDPNRRLEAISRIKQLVAAESSSASIQSPPERWLLDLMEMPNSTDQIDHFERLLTESEGASFDSLNWLSDFLMLDRNVPTVRVLRTWLDRESTDVSPVEQRLRETVASRRVAASRGVKLFPDFAAYAIDYEFYDLLQTCIDLGICRLNINHMHQAVEKADAHCLRLILPQSVLVEREVAGLLRHCVEKNKKDYVRLFINQYDNNLTYPIMEFLGMAEELEGSRKL